MELIQKAYAMTPDNLIVGNSQSLAGKIVEVEVSAGTVSEIKRGQIIDFAEGKYSLHAKSGTPSVIAAETVAVGATETKIPIGAYTSGDFNAAAIVTSEVLTAADVETLREKNIILK